MNRKKSSPLDLYPELYQRFIQLFSQGVSFRLIAEQLNKERQENQNAWPEVTKHVFVGYTHNNHSKVFKSLVEVMGSENKVKSLFQVRAGRSRLGRIGAAITPLGQKKKRVRNRKSPAVVPPIAEKPKAQPLTPPIVLRSVRKTPSPDCRPEICKWPIGHPGDADFHFCTEKALSGKPYCEEHCGTAFVKDSALNSKRARQIPV